MKRIKDLKSGDVVRGMVLLLNSASRMDFKNKGGFYLSLHLQDVSGEVEGKVWDVTPDMEALPELCKEKEGVFVSVDCRVDEYREKLQLTVSKLQLLSEDEINPADFLPMVERDRTDLFNQIRNLIEQITDPDYKKLVLAVLSDEEIRKGFLDGIGGIKMHHNYRGGLMEHSLEVALIALNLTKNDYLYPELNPSLLIAGALLHDIGKVNEYRYSKNFSMNPYDIEHRYGGIGIIERILEKYKLDIPLEKVWSIKHIIISHHGKHGGDDIPFQFPEAIAIHNADAMSAHINGMLKTKGMLNKPFGSEGNA
jgi:3'-5' exoribonuclease